MTNLDNATDLVGTPSTDDMADVWGVLTSPVYRVIDEEGVNTHDARIRRLDSGHWLYVDESSGYEIMSKDDVESLIAVPEDKHVPLGWDVNGNVIEL